MRSKADIRHTMRAVADIRKITSAMKLVSTAKMQKAQSRFEQSSIYFGRVQETVRDILEHSDTLEHPFLEKSYTGVSAFIVIASDKGMCGGYNHGILDLAADEMEKHSCGMVIPMGQMALAGLRNKGIAIDDRYVHFVQEPTIDSVRKLTNDIVKKYLANEISELYIVFTEYVNRFIHKPKLMRILPLDMETLSEVHSPADYSGYLTYTPSPEAVFSNMVPQCITGIIYSAIVQAMASENCARMAAMEEAVKNADENLAKLRLELNTSRQFAITQEISEIAAAMEAQK